MECRWIIWECERFFRSEWFKALTNVDGEALMRRIQEEQEADEKRREALFAPAH